MISDGQRREIAANLRSESEAWLDTFPDSTLNDEDNDAIMFDISRFMLFEGTPTVGEFYARLADLIERPTCTVVSVIFRDSLDEYEVELSCGDSIRWLGSAEDLAFCPSCGAEVIPHAERRD